MITPEGEALFVKAVRAMHAFNQTALDGVTDEEMQALHGTLAKILHNLIGSDAKTKAILDFERV